MEIKKSPFKLNVIEKDPNGFGVRYKEIIDSLEALYNNRSIVISGPRGIGKSSFGYQLQRAMEGDDTLLQRSGVDIQFPKTMCAFYACDPNLTLAELILDILYTLERKVILLPQYQQDTRKTSFEVNIGIIKTAIEKEAKREKRSPATLALQFVEGIDQIVRSLQSIHLNDACNIMIDELDQLTTDINFGHFIKIVHETLIRKDLQNVSFIFAGQAGIYTRLLNEDNSFERIVRHVSLPTLDADASEHILVYASSKATPTFEIPRDAKGLIMALSSGFPYVLHFLGDAAYVHMENDGRMQIGDVINGISHVLQHDKKEKYLQRLMGLTNEEFLVVLAMSQYSPKSIPAEIPFEWLSRKVGDYFNDDDRLRQILDELKAKGHLLIWEEQNTLMFAEELFRVFIAMVRIEQRENQIRRQYQNPELVMRDKNKEERELMRMALSGDIDNFLSFGELNAEDKRLIANDITESLQGLTYTTAWEEDDVFDSHDPRNFFDDNND